jgi:hypothetical protein
MAITSLADRLSIKVNPYDNLDTDWVQYIKDHRSVLMSTAVTTTVPANVMFTHRYRMSALLKKLGSDSSITWIVMWLNQLKTHADVVNLNELILPTMESIKTLYQSYLSYRQKLNKLE